MKASTLRRRENGHECRVELCGNPVGLVDGEGSQKGGTHHFPEWVKGKLDGLEATLGEILDQSNNEGRPSNIIADEIARQRIEEKRAAKLGKVA